MRHNLAYVGSAIALIVCLHTPVRVLWCPEVLRRLVRRPSAVALVSPSIAGAPHGHCAVATDRLREPKAASGLRAPRGPSSSVV